MSTDRGPMFDVRFAWILQQCFPRVLHEMTPGASVRHDENKSQFVSFNKLDSSL